MIRKNTIFAKLLALILVLGLIVGCFAGCGNDNSRDDDDDDRISSNDDEDDEDGESTKPSDEPVKPSDKVTEPSDAPQEPSDEVTEPSDAPQEPSNEVTEPTDEPTAAPTEEPPTEPAEMLVEYQWNGITFFLGEGFEESFSDAEVATYYSDDMDVFVTVYELADFGTGIVNSRKFANAYCDAFYDRSTVSKVGFVYYSTALTDEGLEITGFYTEGDYGWAIAILCADIPEIEESAIAYVTSGTVAPGTIPEVPAEPEEITIWVPYEDQANGNGWLNQMLAAFVMAHPEYNITFTLDTYSEVDASIMVGSNPEAAADLYFFVNDQIGSLVNAGGLMALPGTYAQYVRDNNSQTLINSVTYTDGSIYGFPMTNNTWFMYYDKSVFTEDDVKSLDVMLTKGKVCLPLANSWNAGCFFLGCGGKIFGDDGNDASAGIQFGEANGGYIAAKKMIELVSNPNVVTGGMDSGRLSEGKVDACFSGSWDAAKLKNDLGDRLGVAPLPTFEADGHTYQMKAMSGSNAIGVNPYSSNPELALELAAFLSGAEAQLARYEDRGVIPACKELLENPTIQNDPVAMAEIYTMTYCSVVQPFIPQMGNYWTPMEQFGRSISNGDIYMDNYKDMVDQLMDMLNRTGW